MMNITALSPAGVDVLDDISDLLHQIRAIAALLVARHETDATTANAANAIHRLAGMAIDHANGEEVTA